ncbi:Holliday junction branch migration protein RuvA [Candidatus Saccharibacteria bacterium]|nr:Holliday junction branch migration protein RuvA [Candidatus Saccharibacteria bacterium]
MIAKITGTVSELLTASAIVDVAGVGYEVFVTPTTHERISVNDQAVLYIAEQIKEDAHTLYGFLTLNERNMYYSLTSVTGVGPKAGVAILSHHSVEEIQSGILAGNISLFSNVSGIGKKTAQRIILELKGKLVEAPMQKANPDDPAHQALISLGFTAKDAMIALEHVDKKLDTNQRVKEALKGVKP